MNPVSRVLGRLAAAIGFYGCDSAHLAALNHVHFSLDGFVTGTSRRDETPG